MISKSILEKLDDWLFCPQSPAPVALFRICYGAIAFTCFAWVYPNLLDLYGPQGYPSLPVERQILGSATSSLFFYLPASNETTYILWGLLLLSALFVTIGFLTRTSSILLYVMLISFQQRNWLLTSANDEILSIMGFLVIFSSAGACFSLDSWLKGARSWQAQWQIKAAPWAQRLLQIQWALVYFQSVLFKLFGSTWWDGTAVYYAISLEEYKRFSLPFLFQYLWQIKLTTWSTLVVETLLFTAIFIKRYRYWVMAMGILLHLGLEVMMNIPFLELLSIACFLTFVEGDDLQKLTQRLQSLKPMSNKQIEKLSGS